MAMEGKTLRKGQFEDESEKRHEKCRQPVQDQNMTAEKSWAQKRDDPCSLHPLYDLRRRNAVSVF